nr:disease resistance protein RPV1-like isoform X1 [Ziziphus jujuba var. spinosa]XP_048319711.1 disease resistance protein RPV1-like isoform X1 [Ziziphus jujuba var. spinosa]XP_048319712.1 disease resistance protein RPV1-like isoform X1 [Ziziphus jujuba var. spinosa]
MASTSFSSANRLCKQFDVFLNFRGEDTRGFTNNLCDALAAKDIFTFMDDYEIERGDEISPALRKAIEESKISVVIFSENYDASSTWCLNELVHILECKKNNGQTVMPVFYGIDPSVVQKQNGSYGIAFNKLEERFRDRIEKVHQWRAALTEVSNLRGWDSKNYWLRRKKVLIVLDDVDSSILLDALVRENHQLAPGSRIIVTSRNRQVLKGVSDDIYKVQRLNSFESFHLFCLHAFKSDPPAIDDQKMISEVISYAYGNPLALKVLGFSLHSRNKEEWESALKKLKRFSNPDIQDVLRISYEQLDDKGMKDTFLDIACIFDSSFARDYAESILVDNPYVKIDITGLLDKSLIENSEVLKDNELLMNDLIRQMGRQIARDEDEQPGNRCRLCDAKDACYVLENKTGTAAIEVISFNMSEITQNVRVCRSAFSNMCNLRILKVYCDNIGGYGFKVSIPNGLDSYLSNKLRYFRWDLYPSKSLPSKFNPENLVELALRGSHLENLWNYKVQSLPMLRRIDLSYSKFLTQLPDLSRSPNLERLNLEGCTSLVEVLSPIQNLDKLAYLNLNGCTKLKNLKDTSRSTGYLDFILHGGIKNLLKNICQPSLTSQAHIPQKFQVNLTCLILSGTAIEEADPSIGYLPGLVQLDMSYCTRLKSLPTSICNLKSLEMLSLAFCSKLEKLPPLPSTLLHLGLYCCESLKSLSELPSLCFSLSANYCKTLEKISTWRAPLLHNMKIINFNFFCGHIDFYGCEKLDQNTRNSILVDRAVLKILFRMKFGMTGPNSHDFRYPGDEIPKWFNYQTCGTSIKIMLCPNWNNANFLGLAFCIVLDQNKTDPNISLCIDCKLNFRTMDDDHLHEYHDSRALLERKVSSDHLLMWYVAKLALQRSEKMVGLNWPSTCRTEASFHVLPCYYDCRALRYVKNLGSEYGQIKKFGIRFVYMADTERFDAETKSGNIRHYDEYCESSGSEAKRKNKSYFDEYCGFHGEEDVEWHPTIKSKRLKVILPLNLRD